MRTLLRQCLHAAIFVFLAYSSVLPAQADSVEPLVAEGDRQWAEGQYDLAQESFEQALKIEPRSVPLHMKLAGLQLFVQDFKGCIATYQRTIGLDPNNAKAWIGLGFAYLHTGKDSLSLAAFNEAMRLDPAIKPSLAPLLAKLGAS